MEPSSVSPPTWFFPFLFKFPNYGYSGWSCWLELFSLNMTGLSELWKLSHNFHNHFFAKGSEKEKQRGKKSRTTNPSFSFEFQGYSSATIQTTVFGNLIPSSSGLFCTACLPPCKSSPSQGLCVGSPTVLLSVTQTSNFISDLVLSYFL